MSVSALVLAGGRAERMSGRKPERPWRDGTLLSHVVAVARAVSDDVLIAPGPHDLRGLVERPDDLTWVDDDPLVGGEGPLGGLLAGLERAVHPWVWLLACDMPWVAPDALDGLLAARDGHEAVVAYRGARGVEPFGALVRRDAAPTARARAAAGERSLRGLLETLGLRLVADPPMTRGIPTLPMLHNVNTLDELADARRRDAVDP